MDHTLQLDARVRVVQLGPYFGRLGTIVSIDGWFRWHVQIDDIPEPVSFSERAIERIEDD